MSSLSLADPPDLSEKVNTRPPEAWVLWVSSREEFARRGPALLTFTERETALTYADSLSEEARVVATHELDTLYSKHG